MTIKPTGRVRSFPDSPVVKSGRVKRWFEISRVGTGRIRSSSNAKQYRRLELSCYRSSTKTYIDRTCEVQVVDIFGGDCCPSSSRGVEERRGEERRGVGNQVFGGTNLTGRVGSP